MSDNKQTAQALSDLLSQVRAIRNNQPQGDVRYLLNAACDRLDVAISKLVNQPN